MQEEAQAEVARPDNRRRWPALVACAGFIVCALLTLVPGARTLAPAAAPPQDENLDFSKFLHNSPRHASLACDDCHQREGRNVQPRLPGHKSCTGCHLAQFVASSGSQCAICHSNIESPGNYDVKAFPGLKSFNAVFPHAPHENGAGRPTAGCDSCHAPAGRGGVARAVPVRLAAHGNCYECHSPGGSAGGALASCGACHKQGGFRPASTSARSFSVGFSHNDHGPRQRLDCAACHNVRGGAQESRDEVTAPRPAQHLNLGRGMTCASCHDNRRAFGGEDFTDCKRCHTGATFSFGGGGGRRRRR